MIISSKIDELLTKEFVGLETTLKILNLINKTDLSIELEDFLIPVFNIYFTTEFININKYEKNYPGIDLYSEKEKIALQITCNTTAVKRKSTVSKVQELVDSNKVEINTLYIFVLTSSLKNRKDFIETAFFKNTNVLTIPSILSISTEKKEQVYEYIINTYKSNFSSVYMKYKKLIATVFVETNVYVKALESIKNKHVLILNGNAGTGKTITSYKILFDYIEKGYIYIDNLKTISKFKDSDNKYIIFVDDVISSTTVFDADNEKINESFALIDIANCNLKVILNSRTNIISTYHTTRTSFMIDQYKQFFVSTEILTSLEKFNIFLSHIEKSYDKESLLTLFKDNMPIIRIIRHNKFNPRIIEHYKKNTIINNLNLATDILNSLDNPDRIYNEQYKQLTDLEKEIMSYVAIMRGTVTINQIINYFNNVMKFEIEDCLTNLTDCFLLEAELRDNLGYTFFNPSIKDFCKKIIDKIDNLDNHFTVDKTVNELVYLYNFNNISFETKKNVIKGHQDKRNLLKSINNHSRELFDSFTADLIDIFIEDSNIPFFYRKDLSDKEIYDIEAKFDIEKVFFIEDDSVTYFFENLLHTNSTKLVQLIVKKKILSDYIIYLEHYIYAEVESYFSYDNYDKEDIISVFDDCKIKELSIKFQESIVHSIMDSYENDYFWSAISNFNTLLQFVNEEKDSINNVYSVIKYLTNENQNVYISAHQIVEYIEDNYENNDGDDDDDELNLNLSEFRKRVDVL